MNIWDAVKEVPILVVAKDLGLQVVKELPSYATAVCIFHDDHQGGGGQGNLSLLKTKNTFKCFKCGAKGSVIDLWMKAAGVDNAAAAKAIAEKYGVHYEDEHPVAQGQGKAKSNPKPQKAEKPKPTSPPPQEKKPWAMEQVQKAHETLLDPKNAGHLEHLLKMRSLTKEYVQKKKVGLIHVYGGLYYSIPALEADGKTVLSVRLHSRINRKDKRMLLGNTTKVLYDLAVYDPLAPEAWIVEGEGCLWRLDSLGKNAITSFAGAPTIPAVFVAHMAKLGDLSQKKIYLVPDNDSEGELCMAKIRFFLPKEAQVFKVYWPPDFPKKADVDDWFSWGRTEQELQVLVKTFSWDEAEQALMKVEEHKEAVAAGRKVYEHANCYFRIRGKGFKSEEKCLCGHVKSEHKQVELNGVKGFVYGACVMPAKKGQGPCPCDAFEMKVKESDKKKAKEKEDGEEGEQVDVSPDYSERISNFVLRGRALVKIDRHVHTRVDVISWDGKKDENLFLPPDAWRSRQKLMGYLPDPRYEFKGSDNDVAEIGSLAVRTIKDAELKKGVDYIGFVDDCFVGPDFFIGKNGLIENPPVEYLPQGLHFDQVLKIHPHDDRKEVLKQFCDTILMVNKPPVVVPTLGWMFACYFKEKIRERINYFPILSYFGTSGAGKTSFVTTMLRLFGMKKGLQLFNAHQTTFVKDRLQASTNCIPVAVDEFKEDIGRDAINDWKHRIRSSFSGEITARGRQDLTLKEYPFRAPLLILGEMSVIREQAITERTIAVEPKKSYIGQVEREAFKQVQKDIPIEVLFPTIVQWCLKDGFGKMYEMWGLAIQDLTEMKLPWLPDRVWDNLTVLMFGVRAFEEYAKSMGVKFHVSPETKKETVQHLTSGVLEVAQRTKMGFDYFLEALAVMAKNGVIQRNRDYDLRGEWLYMHLSSCVSAFRKWARETNYTFEILDQKEYRNQAAEIEKMEYGRYVFKISKDKRLGENILKCIQINLKSAGRFGLDIGGFGYATEDAQAKADDETLPAPDGPEVELPPELLGEEGDLFE